VFDLAVLRAVAADAAWIRRTPRLSQVAAGGAIGALLVIGASVLGAMGRLPAAVLLSMVVLAVLAVPVLCLGAVVAQRRRATRDLAERQRLEAVKAAIVRSLDVHVAVLDRHGIVVDVDPRPGRLAAEAGFPTPAGAIGVGDSYLEAWRTGPGTPRAAEAVAGIEQVLDGSRAAFTMEHASGGPAAEPWFALSVVPLAAPEGGAVACCTDITERKRAETDAQRSRQELAHFTRVSTMGELTASLAHELNQPLTAILTNARAALRFLDAVPPQLGELREILSDIAADDKRAGELIQRLRGLLRKGEPQRGLLDVNALVQEVAELLESDAIIRNVAVTLDLTPGSTAVVGDRVQLQQVVLNLLLNGMEAMAEDARERTIVVRTEARGGEAVHVSVQDTGVGLRDADDAIFAPFYTTKPAGMGMGLAIARSIVEAHGGVIRAKNNSGGGATVHFTLPAAGRAAA
jgi:signal transduction histidine kinase